MELSAHAKYFSAVVYVIRDAGRSRSIEIETRKSKKPKLKESKIANVKIKKFATKNFQVGNLRKISPNLSVAILSVKAAKLSACSDVAITTRSADQCPKSVYFLLL
jgi:hypothetical protein